MQSNSLSSYVIMLYNTFPLTKFQFASYHVHKTSYELLSNGNMITFQMDAFKACKIKLECLERQKTGFVGLSHI